MHACTRWMLTGLIPTRSIYISNFFAVFPPAIFSSISPKDPSFPSLSLSLSHFFLSSLAFPSHATPFFHPHISKISFSSYFSVDEFLHVRNFFFLSLLFAFLVSRQCDAMRFRPTRASDPSLCSLCSIGGKRKVVEFSRDRRGGEVGA